MHIHTMDIHTGMHINVCTHDIAPINMHHPHAYTMLYPYLHFSMMHTFPFTVSDPSYFTPT